MDAKFKPITIAAIGLDDWIADLERSTARLASLRKPLEATKMAYEIAQEAYDNAEYAYRGSEASMPQLEMLAKEFEEVRKLCSANDMKEKFIRTCQNRGCVFPVNLTDRYVFNPQAALSNVIVECDDSGKFETAYFGSNSYPRILTIGTGVYIPALYRDVEALRKEAEEKQNVILQSAEYQEYLRLKEKFGSLA